MDNGESSSTDNSSRPWESYNTVFTNGKAGMEGVDKEKVQRIVYEMSKGSKYFQNEERKEALMKQKIDHMRDRCTKLSSSDLSNYHKVVGRRILELEATRDLSRVWLHVDMDAFYAAVETLSNPSLTGKPMAVGGLSMISTANYEARKFGVRAAMPGFIARKLCPDLIFVPVDFTKYTHYSDLTRKVFSNYDPNFIAGSLDEAYLDITEVCRERGLSGGEIAEELRSSVYSDTGLTCSAGVAANRLLAKVCSDINKPNGQFVLQNDRSTIMTFISSLPIRKIGGIGKVTEHILKDALGIKTCEEMVHKGSLLYALFSQSSADFFLSVGLGLGKTDTPEVRSRKSISSERTFAATGDERLLYSKLAEIAEMLSDDMKKEGLTARTLTLKLKTASFEIRSRAVSLQRYTCSSDDILKHATKLLKAELPVSIRLIGLRMSQFSEEIRNSDPSQGTITKFIIQKDSSRQDLDENDSFDLDASRLSNDESVSLSFGSLETSYAHLKDVVEYEERSQIDTEKVITNQECIEKEERQQVLEGDALLIKHKECKPDTSHSMNDNSNAQNTVAVSVFPQMEQLFWIDGYKCALCGIELPPSFVEERQEHSDFHLAQRLQSEESGSSSSTTPSKRRILGKEKANSKPKKQKPDQKDGSKHIPIHIFFTKSNQNSFVKERYTEEMKMAMSPLKLNISPSNCLGDPKSLPSMSDILTSSRARKLDLKIETLGPFFRVTGKNADTCGEVGRAEGVVRPRFGRGLVLHLDTIRLTKETKAMDKSVLGVGLYAGAIAIRHGYDCGCRTAQLLAIYDSDLYHSKLVRFYRRLGFEEVKEVSGSSIGDMADMLVWGGVGTRMDANIRHLLLKWSKVFLKSHS